MSLRDNKIPTEADKAAEQAQANAETKPAGSKFTTRSATIVGIVIVLVAIVLVVAYLRSGDNNPIPATPSATKEGVTAEVSGDTPVATTPVSEASSATGEPSGDTASGDKPWLNADNTDSGSADPAKSEAGTTPKGNLTEPSDKIVPGVKDPSANQYVRNYSQQEKDAYLAGTKSTKLIKDLNGHKVPENYDISNIKTVVDFVSYTKHRTTTDVGMELYYLDGTYNGRKCKIQVPFRIFKELDPKGVVVVDVEVTEINNQDNYSEPYQMVTGFTVRDDYKKYLQDAAAQAANGF